MTRSRAIAALLCRFFGDRAARASEFARSMVPHHCRRPRMSNARSDEARMRTNTGQACPPEGGPQEAFASRPSLLEKHAACAGWAMANLERATRFDSDGTRIGDTVSASCH